MTRKLSVSMREQPLVELNGKNEWESRERAQQKWTTEIIIEMDKERFLKDKVSSL